MTQHRFINLIARDICKLWKARYNAEPYLEAMFHLQTIDDTYGCDSAKSIILYFLSNASTWRGEDARRIKAELKAIAGVK